MQEEIQNKKHNLINYTLFNGLCLSLVCCSIFLLSGHETFLFIGTSLALLVVLEIILLILFMFYHFGAFPVMEIQLNLYLLLLLFGTLISTNAILFYGYFL